MKNGKWCKYEIFVIKMCEGILILSYTVCLFMNLLSNTSRAGENIIITAYDNEIRICNKGDFIDKSMLRLLNGNRSIPENKIKGRDRSYHCISGSS